MNRFGFIKFVLVAVALISNITACVAKESWACSIKRDGVMHKATVRIDNDSVVSIDYVSFTRSESGVNSCHVSPANHEKPMRSGGAMVFRLDGGDTAVVVKQGNYVFLDFSNTNLMNYCGQSATIAAKLTIKKGVRKCVSVENQ